MGWRFRKSFKFVPGLRINLSKTGVSESVGKAPVTVNLRGDRVMSTVSLPGTGLSYRAQRKLRAGSILGWLVQLLVLALFIFLIVP